MLLSDNEKRLCACFCIDESECLKLKESGYPVGAGVNSRISFSATPYTPKVPKRHDNTAYIKQKNVRGVTKPTFGTYRVEFDGKEFNSLQECVLYYGGGRVVSSDKSLSFETRLFGKKKVKDHLGNVFANPYRLCKYYGVPVQLYYNHKHDWGADEVKRSVCLGLYEIEYDIDHKGNRYLNRVAMSHDWGITLNTFILRKRKGWTLQEILETPESLGLNKG